MATTVDSFYNWLSQISNPANVLKVKSQPQKQPQKPAKKWLIESVFDDLPIEKEDEPSFVRISVSDLKNIEEASDTICSALRKDGFFILSLDSETTDLVQEIFGHSAKFFTQPQMEKEKMREISVFGRDSGYSRIYFDNTDSKREPEQRDVIEVRYLDAHKLTWPQEDFKLSVLELYQQLFKYSTQILEAISVALECDAEEFTYLLGNVGESKEDLTPKDATETNFCLFRYQDDEQRYTEMQKCMVHRDSGLITLLPRSTFPGIHVLDRKCQEWISVEHFTNPNDVLVFCGDAMEYLTSGYLRSAIHRVVREPGLERYSMPFEVKPHLQTFLKKFNTDVIKKFLATEKYERVVINPQEPAFHSAICDKCSTYLVGNRWKCKDCEDYDLCDTCMQDRDEFHADHSFHLLTKRLPFYVDGKDMVRAADFMEEDMMYRRLKKRWRLLQVQPPFTQ